SRPISRSNHGELRSQTLSTERNVLSAFTNGGEPIFCFQRIYQLSRAGASLASPEARFRYLFDVLLGGLTMKIFTRQRCFAIFVAAMLLVGRFGHAQAVYGSLFGTVLDNTGAVVPNAKVTVTDVAKGTQTVVQSNGQGFWRADNLIPD